MPNAIEERARETSAPNAILDHMRRRIARVGLLVAFLSVLLAAAIAFVICACVRLY